MSTAGSDFDTVIAVYTAAGGDFSSLTEAACDNDGGIDGQDSLVSFDVTADTIYYVAVDGVEAATGVVQFAYAMDLPIDLEIASSGGLGTEGEAITEYAFNVTAVPGLDFVVEVSIDLTTWSPVVIARADENGHFQFSDAQFDLGTSAKYFRVFYP